VHCAGRNEDTLRRHVCWPLVAGQKKLSLSFNAEKFRFFYCYYCIISVVLVLFRVSNAQWIGF